MSVLFSDDFSGGSIGTDWATHGGVWAQSGGVVAQTSVAADADPKRLQVEGTTFPTDLEVLARVRVDSWAGGDNSRAGVSLAGDGSGYGFNLLFHNDTGTVTLLWDQIAWGPTAAFAWSVGSWYWFRFRQEGGTLSGKVWADGDPEPSSWTLTQAGWGPRAGAPGLCGGSMAGATTSFDDFSVSDLTGVGGDTTPPTLSGATVPTGGTTLTATLSESGCGPASGSGGFTLAGTNATVASWAISGTTLTLTLTRKVYVGQAVTLSYSRAATTDDVHDASSNYLADFSGLAVANNSTQRKPILLIGVG